MKRPIQRKQTGFTLVEIAIVLVIIGLLLGGVLKGPELITQAKIKNVSNDLTGITAAVYGYQDRFKSLPGDDPNGKTRWADTDSISTTAGEPGNGKIGDATEQALFWQHLRKAGFVAGDVKSGSPLNAVGGKIEAIQTALGIGGTAICTHNLPAKISEALDVQMDDGKPNTGTLRSAVETTSAVTTSAPGITGYTDDGSTLYVMCKQL